MDSLKMDEDKKRIIEIFRQNVKGLTPHRTGKAGHDGGIGHWLEAQFGKRRHDGDISPDFYGYELKCETTSNTTTFGDWSPNIRIYRDKETKHFFKGRFTYEKQDDFCKVFGAFNEEKQRYSWSGRSCPKVGKYNICGQILVVDDNLDISVRYSFEQDTRPDKAVIVPKELQEENILIARWYGPNSEHLLRSKRELTLSAKLEKKFNQKGWFTCLRNSEGQIDKICFGRSLNYCEWIELIRQGIVYFDSGMHQGNKRPYSEWRAANKFWHSLIDEEYD